ncbi:F-box/kelch-repeat protein At3g06240-like isoform X2 [Cornus florida]|uniref:F-box/kelch-repeat protein At3g06240-like isoform X2 n=1 Tax=Cornus florida TaxID=4283 RepID=UPI0028995BF5|nr:F-box/kelch-repeat protein At3g06240-like isoform X2 [Cornus florida]
MSYGSKLPVDMLLEILYRLPPKSLCRFKSVSKSFFLLISDPNFHEAHLNRINNKPQRFIFYSDCLYSVDCTEASNNDAVTAMKHDFFQIADPDEFDIMGSCNGLILVSDGDGVKLLLNPSTREGKELPDSPFRHQTFSVYTMYGLGYDSSTDDYKVVTIEGKEDIDDDDDDDDDRDDDDDFINSIVSVYSLKTDSWRRIENVPCDDSPLEPCSLVLVNGCLHWLSYTSSGSFVVSAFDLGDEKFRVVETPCSPDQSNFLCFNLGVFGGCLCMCVSLSGDQIDFWVMKEYGVTESWTKHTICATDLYKMEPLCFLGDEEVLVDMNGEKLVALNAKEKTSRDIVVSGIPAVYRAGMTYVETLVSPYRNCNCGCRIDQDYEESESWEKDQLDRIKERVQSLGLDSKWEPSWVVAKRLEKVSFINS